MIASLALKSQEEAKNKVRSYRAVTPEVDLEALNHLAEYTQASRDTKAVTEQQKTDSRAALNAAVSSRSSRQLRKRWTPLAASRKLNELVHSHVAGGRQKDQN